jgi:hypothetical protein
MDAKVALAYWLALPAERRTFQAVADRFRVDRSRISQIAKRDSWRDRLDELELEGIRDAERKVRETARRLALSRAQRIGNVLELFDRANALALSQIPLKPDGTVDLDALVELGDRPLDRLLERMPGLFRMAELAAGEATDRIHVTEIQPVLLAFARIALLDREPGERERILGMLTAASSGLVEIEGTATRVA